MDRSGTLGVTVATLTRRRPEMLSELIDSFDRLESPPDCRVRFLVVENDEHPNSRIEIDRRGGHLALGPLNYVLEPELGIPFGRNRAAREALAAGDDLLAFVDDDEVVDPTWLARLIRGYRDSRAVLLGGPLAIRPPEPGLSWTQEKMHECIRRRYRTKERRAARRSGLDGTRRTTIVTNNWLAETGLFSDQGIWFDEQMRFTGGTDAKFYAEVKARNLPTGWVKDARVYEGIPPERLTFAYQFRRGRDQSNTNFHRKIQKTPNARWSVLFTVPLKSLGVIVLAAALIPSMGATLLELARTSGWIVGRTSALTGARSALYVNTTGK